MNKDIKVIIMAGGKQKRYAPETPKQFIKIDGERIIERSIKAFKDFGDLYVITDNPEFDYLEDLGCKIARTSEKTHELSKFMSSYDIWKDADEVLFIYGDCYISDKDIEIIKTNRENEDFAFFGIHSEMCALWMEHKNFDKFVTGVNYIKALEDRAEGGLCGSWTIYRLMLGKDIMEHKHYTNFVRFYDESTDFDAEWELYEWLKKYTNHTGSVK